MKGQLLNKDIERVNHRDDADDLREKGRLIERTGTKLT